MVTSVSHIAIFVPDLRKAEIFYKDLFGMELIGREMEAEDGLWYTLPFDKGWEDVQAAGLELHMTALRTGNFVFALFGSPKPLGQVFAIGLSASEEEIKSIHDRLPIEIIQAYQTDLLEFVDPFQITWQIAVQPNFSTAGIHTNRWIEI